VITVEARVEVLEWHDGDLEVVTVPLVVRSHPSDPNLVVLQVGSMRLVVAARDLARAVTVGWAP